MKLSDFETEMWQEVRVQRRGWGDVCLVLFNAPQVSAHVSLRGIRIPFALSSADLTADDWQLYPATEES